MYSKTSKFSPKQNEITDDFDSSLMRRKEENERVNFAIFNAEENLNGYLKDFKRSFVLEQWFKNTFDFEFVLVELGE